ncbi:MAG: hypothetical protein SFY92_10280 [Verrucomicrobiae bacterium]|nr:hypothetical protein [Verrucomicrobiae bacterium]
MNPPDPLDSLLKNWSVEPEIPSRFQADVWNRISVEAPESLGIDWLDRLLDFALEKKWHTALSLFLVAITGLGLAYLGSSASHRPDPHRMAQSYAQFIDPAARHQGNE